MKLKSTYIALAATVIAVTACKPAESPVTIQPEVVPDAYDYGDTLRTGTDSSYEQGPYRFDASSY